MAEHPARRMLGERPLPSDPAAAAQQQPRRAGKREAGLAPPPRRARPPGCRSRRRTQVGSQRASGGAGAAWAAARRPRQAPGERPCRRSGEALRAREGASLARWVGGTFYTRGMWERSPARHRLRWGGVQALRPAAYTSRAPSHVTRVLRRSRCLAGRWPSVTCEGPARLS